MILETIFLTLPLIPALLLPIVTVFSKKFGRILNLASYLAGIAIGIYLVANNLWTPKALNIGGWNNLFAINLYFSPLSLIGGLLIYTISFIININDFKKVDTYYNLLYQLFIFANLGLLMTADFFNMFVLFEVASIAIIALIAKGKDKDASFSAFKYILLSSVISMFMLASVGLLYSATGTLNIAKNINEPILSSLFGLLIGLGILSILLYHSEIVPFASWVPDAYKGSFYSFTASLVGIGSLTGGLLLLRLWGLYFRASGSIFSQSLPVLVPIVFIAGIVSILIGELSALREKNIKKLLGFSSIGQMGIVLLAVVVGTEVSVKSALFLILAHTTAKVLLILIAQFFNKVAETDEWRKMTGIARSYPVLGASFIIGSISLMGIPLTIGFIGKFSLLLDMIRSSNILNITGVAAILTASIIEGFYFMRLSHTFFEESDVKYKGKNQVVVAVTAVVLAVLIIVLGVYPDMINGFIDRISGDLINYKEYISNILGM